MSVPGSGNSKFQAPHKAAPGKVTRPEWWARRRHGIEDDGKAVGGTWL